MAAMAFLALGLFTFDIFSNLLKTEEPVSGKVLFFAGSTPQIYDPNGVITCSDMGQYFFAATDINDGTLTYVPQTGEILLCGGSKYYNNKHGDQCLVMNNREFVPHSQLTQLHLYQHHAAVINGTVWIFGGVLSPSMREGYVIESLVGGKWSIQDAPRTPVEHNFDACSVFTGEALLLIGGYKKDYKNYGEYSPTASVSKLIPGSSQWESLSPLPAPRDNHGCVYLQPDERFPNGSVLVGGGTGSDSLLYDISQDSWIPAGEIGASHARGSLVDVDGRIIFAGGTSRVDEFHLKNLGTDKPTWTMMNSSLHMIGRDSAEVIPIQHWNHGKSCKIPDPLPTPPPPPATQGINDQICLSSPNYPSNYPNNMRLKKTFSVPDGEDIEITLMDIDVEGSIISYDIEHMCKDFLRFYDGKGNAVKVRRCEFKCPDFICEHHNIAMNLPSKFVISTSSASFYFHSDGSQTRPRRGFKFCYKPARRWRDDGRCGYNLKNAYGTIGECDPLSMENGKGPCCSSHGFCGPFSVHCDCVGCVNYKKGHAGCNAENGISCCPTMSYGDNNGDVFGGKEIFLQENQLMVSSLTLYKLGITNGITNFCQANCQKLYPESVGITQSTTQKYTTGQPKCWCEFGSPNFQNSENYQTCLFNR